MPPQRHPDSLEAVDLQISVAKAFALAPAPMADRPRHGLGATKDGPPQRRCKRTSFSCGNTESHDMSEPISIGLSTLARKTSGFVDSARIVMCGKNIRLS